MAPAWGVVACRCVCVWGGGGVACDQCWCVVCVFVPTHPALYLGFVCCGAVVLCAGANDSSPVHSAHTPPCYSSSKDPSFYQHLPLFLLRCASNACRPSGARASALGVVCVYPPPPLRVLFCYNPTHTILSSQQHHSQAPLTPRLCSSYCMSGCMWWRFCAGPYSAVGKVIGISHFVRCLSSLLSRGNMRSVSNHTKSELRLKGA